MTEPDEPGGIRAALRRVVAPHRPVLALVLLAACCYLPGVWLRDAWNPDEPRYAEVAREMVARGDFILPHLNGRVYGEKPPLYFWLGAMAGALPGVPDASGTRLVSALAGLGTLLLTFRLGRRLADDQTGWLAALALATSAMFLVHASSGVIDGTLTFLVVAALSTALRARETSSLTLWICFYLLAGLAIITKGPVGLVVPAGVLLLTGLQENGPRGALAPHAAWGIVLSAAVAAAWLAPAIARGGSEYADVILFKQNLGRAWQSWHHKEPAQFFLKVFPLSFLPWIFVLPAALYGAWRTRKASRASRLALTWFVFTFLFFSVISGKKTRYLLPLFPAAALLVAMEMRAMLPGARRVLSRWRESIPILAAAALLGLFGLALAVTPFGMLPRAVGRMRGLAPDQSAGLLWYAHAPGLLLLLIPGLALVSLAAGALLLGRRDRRASLGSLMAGWVIAAGWAQWVGVPALNHVKSARPLAEAVRQAAGEDGEIVLYRETYAGIFNLYTRRDAIPVISGLDNITAYAQAHPGAVILSSEEDWRRLRERIGDTELTLVAPCRRLGSDTVCASRAGPAQSAGASFP